MDAIRKGRSLVADAISLLSVDIILVRTEERDRIAETLSFALDYISPKEPIASDPSVPAELSRLRASLLLGPAQGWMAVYLSPLLREDDVVEKIARLLSVRVGGSLQLTLNDGTLSYQLYQNGDMIHSYCTSEALPEFRFNPHPKEQSEELVMVLGLHNPSNTLSTKLIRTLERPTEGWSEELYRELFRLLALPSTLPTSFEIFWEDGTLNASLGAGKRAVLAWHEEALVYLEADARFEETTAKRWLH